MVHGESGGELAVLDVLADFVNTQGVAGVAHDSLGFVAGFQLCLAVVLEAGGWLLGGAKFGKIALPAIGNAVNAHVFKHSCSRMDESAVGGVL